MEQEKINAFCKLADGGTFIVTEKERVAGEKVIYSIDIDDKKYGDERSVKISWHNRNNTGNDSTYYTRTSFYNQCKDKLWIMKFKSHKKKLFNLN